MSRLPSGALLPFDLLLEKSARKLAAQFEQCRTSWPYDMLSCAKTATLNRAGLRARAELDGCDAAAVAKAVWELEQRLNLMTKVAAAKAAKADFLSIDAGQLLTM
eukprot:SAG11_NODE_6530_length_1294_cov_0.685356_1_plen_105_part_00